MVRLLAVRTLYFRWAEPTATRHRLCGHFMTRLRRHVTQRMDDDTPQSERREALGRPMPHKHNADRRHHIPKMAFKVQNWPEYEAGLRRRGSLTLWIEDAALECWQTYGPGGQARYSDAAVRPDQPDGAHGVQAAVATGRGPACIGPGVDGPDDFSA